MRALVAGILAQPVAPEIAAMAEKARSQHRNVVAVLAYGSCLRGIATTDSLIDLYVLTADLSGVSTNAISRLACAIVPPNVYYGECQYGGRTYRAKYAVLPLALFENRMTASNPYFWARFAQPAALVWASGAAARAAAVSACAKGAGTMFANAKGLSGGPPDALGIWTEGFKATYQTEFRAEGPSRANSIVEANAEYYREAAELMKDVTPIRANWAMRRFAGKLWSIARLSKAAFTFTGGADYIAWKIERHSGEKVTLSDWQRRHPILAGLTLLPQLLKKGAVR